MYGWLIEPYRNWRCIVGKSWVSRVMTVQVTGVWCLSWEYLQASSSLRPFCSLSPILNTHPLVGKVK